MLTKRKRQKKENEETGGRKEGTSWWCTETKYVYVGFVDVACLLAFRKTLFYGSEVLGKSKVVGKQRR